ncbi:MAG: ABC transporter substrate-binding protein [Granulosicoccaceae bacterium]
MFKIDSMFNNTFKRIIIATSALLFASTALADTTAIKFINDWKWEGPAAPLLLSLDKEYFADEKLDVTLDKGTGSINAIPKVASGEYEMGSADINSLIKWRSENPETAMKAIYIIYNVAPFAVLGRPSLGVIGPTDLEGRILGAPAFDGAFAHWAEFVAFNGILEDKVEIKDVGFPVREPMLAAGDVDAITGFSFTSYVTLQQNGVPKEDISLMLMSDFGLDLYGNAIIVNPEFAKQNPDAVRAFLRAAVLGYQETIANPTAALEHVISRVDGADRDMELSRLIMAIGHHIATEEVRSFGLGDVVDARLEKSIVLLDNIHNFANIPSSDDVFDRSFLPQHDARQIPPAPGPSAAASAK